MLALHTLLSYTSRCLAFCCFESKIAPHYFELANCQATVALAHSCTLSQGTMQRVHGPTQTMEWNMDRDVDWRCLSDIRSITYVSIGPDTNIQIRSAPFLI